MSAESLTAEEKRIYKAMLDNGFIEEIADEVAPTGILKFTLTVTGEVADSKKAKNLCVNWKECASNILPIILPDGVNGELSLLEISARLTQVLCVLAKQMKIDITMDEFIAMEAMWLSCNGVNQVKEDIALSKINNLRNGKYKMSAISKTQYVKIVDSLIRICAITLSDGIITLYEKVKVKM